MTQTSFGDATADVWRWSFLRILRRKCRMLGVEASSVQRVAHAARATYLRNIASSPDRHGPTSIGINALILESYRELVQSGVDEVTAYDAVRDTFQKNFCRTTRLVMRIVMTLSRDAVSSLSRVSLAKIFHGVFGASFAFHDRVEDDRVVLVITKCAGQAFFEREGEPLLTRILCGWDHNWLLPIQSSRHQVAVTRPLTMATGASHCEFHIARGTGESSIVDVTIQRRQDIVESLGRTS